MESRDVIILENKPEDFAVFLHCLPDELKIFLRFHLVVDTRNYSVMKDIETMAKNADLHCTIYDGKMLLQNIYNEFALDEWFLKYHKSLKLSLSLIFTSLAKYLYMDDDALLLRDPSPLFNYRFCSGRETVFARITNEKKWLEYLRVFPDFKVSRDEYNHRQLNSGTFIYTNSQDGLAQYIEHFCKYFTSPYFRNEFEQGKFILDEEFLSFWFQMNGNTFVDSRYITIRNGEFAYKNMISPLPCVYHYAVKDLFTPDYRDYFSKVFIAPDAAISGYASRYDFLERKKSEVPSFKHEMRKRFKNA